MTITAYMHLITELQSTWPDLTELKGEIENSMHN
jgi:hypothetical protein